MIDTRFYDLQVPSLFSKDVVQAYRFAIKDKHHSGHGSIRSQDITRLASVLHKERGKFLLDCDKGAASDSTFVIAKTATGSAIFIKQQVVHGRLEHIICVADSPSSDQFFKQPLVVKCSPENHTPSFLKSFRSFANKKSLSVQFTFKSTQTINLLN